MGAESCDIEHAEVKRPGRHGLGSDGPRCTKTLSAGTLTGEWWHTNVFQYPFVACGEGMASTRHRKARAGLLCFVKCCSVAARWYVISEPAWPLLGCFLLRHVHQATAGIRTADFRCVRLAQSGRLVVVGLC